MHKKDSGKTRITQQTAFLCVSGYSITFTRMFLNQTLSP